MTAKTTMTKMTEISMIMTTFSIMNTVSKTEFSQGRDQVRETPPRLVGYQIDGYWKVDNVEPTMMVMTISTKITDDRRADPMEPQ